MNAGGEWPLGTQLSGLGQWRPLLCRGPRLHRGDLGGRPWERRGGENGGPDLHGCGLQRPPPPAPAWPCAMWVVFPDSCPQRQEGRDSSVLPGA